MECVLMPEWDIRDYRSAYEINKHITRGYDLDHHSPQ
jgi:hypothetical protein